MIEGLLHVFFNIYLFRGIACFSIGILLYYLNMILPDTYKKRVVMVGIAVSFLFLLLALWGGDLRTMLGGEENQNFYIQMTVVLFWGPLLIFCSINWKPLLLILKSSPVQALGNISFSLYLWQIVVRTGMHYINLVLDLQLDYSNIYVMLCYMGILGFIAIISTRILSGKKV